MSTPPASAASANSARSPGRGGRRCRGRGGRRRGGARRASASSPGTAASHAGSRRSQHGAPAEPLSTRGVGCDVQVTHGSPGRGLRGDPRIPTVEPDPGHAGAGSEMVTRTRRARGGGRRRDRPELCLAGRRRTAGGHASSTRRPRRARPGWRAACSRRSPRPGPARRSCWSSASRRSAAGPPSPPSSPRRRTARRAAHGRHGRRRHRRAATAPSSTRSPRTSARLGRPVDQLTGRELRRLEPALGPDVRGGLSVPGDLAVDNRVLLAALRTRPSGPVRCSSTPRWRPCWTTGARRRRPLADGTERAAGTVLVAAGAHSAGLHPALDGLVRPVKGEILRLALRPGAFPLPRRTVRALVDGRPVYLVPRARRARRRRHPVRGRLRHRRHRRRRARPAARRRALLPGVAEYALVETAAGLRPGSPDNLPLIGALGPDGLLVATGHDRNGMLLAPVTADAVAGAAARRARARAGPCGRPPFRMSTGDRPVPAAPRR